MAEKPNLPLLIQTTDNYKLVEKLFQGGAKPTLVQLEIDDTIYKINLATRQVEAPEFLAVKSDHEAEIIFFEVDRYYDGIDLSTIPCVVQYKAINKETGEETLNSHLIPFYDIYTKATEYKMLLPWDITNNVSKNASEIIFSFRFFKVDTNCNIIYSLNTLTATSKILDTLNNNKISEETKIPGTLYDEIMTLYRYLYDNTDVYWEVLE